MEKIIIISSSMDNVNWELELPKFYANFVQNCEHLDYYGSSQAGPVSSTAYSHAFSPHGP